MSGTAGCASPAVVVAAAAGLRDAWVLTCHHTIAPPASAAASQRFPGFGQKRASDSATIAPKASRLTPITSHGRSRCSLIAVAAIESSSPASGMTSQAATYSRIPVPPASASAMKAIR